MRNAGLRYATRRSRAAQLGSYHPARAAAPLLADLEAIFFSGQRPVRKTDAGMPHAIPPININRPAVATNDRNFFIFFQAWRMSPGLLLEFFALASLCCSFCH